MVILASVDPAGGTTGLMVAAVLGWCLLLTQYF